MEVGFTEVMIIALLIIILFGPDKIPSIARDLGSG
ncbi:twin-arginine translocase TatA/TatE family subunit, partial [Bergeyella zoohelcum]